MSKCYILGAGASHGYADLKNDDRPPTTREVFIKGDQLRIFSEENFPDLFSLLKEFLNNNLSNLECDIEVFLQKYLIEFYENVKGQAINDRVEKIQSGLSQCFYFIYELFRQYLIRYSPAFDNYKRLSLHYFDCNYSVITLNYDVLFEAALQTSGLGFHYFSGSHFPKSVPLAKIHGSINWINPCQGGIARSNLGKKDFFQIIGPIFSNKINQQKMMVLNLNQIKNISYNDFVRSGIDYDEPAIIPPFTCYKDYSKVSAYEHVWEFARQMLINSSELIIIGCSLRQDDLKLRELLKNKVQKNVKITIVSPETEKIRNKVQELFPNSNIDAEFNTFGEYAKTL